MNKLISLKNTAKLGFAATILVLATACSHETIQPDIANAMEPTPDPIVSEAPPTSFNEKPPETAQTYLNTPGEKTASVKHTKHHRTLIAKHAAKKAKKTAVMAKTQEIKTEAPKNLEIGAAVGSVTTPADLNPPAPPALDNSLAIEANNTDSGWLGLWPYGLFVIGLGGVMFYVTRAQRAKKQGLVYTA